MLVDLAVAQPARAGRFPGATIALRTARRAVRSGVLWGYVFGLTVAATALGYGSTYKTLAQRAEFASLFGTNAGLAAIVGPARRLQTVAGYTVWKCFMFLAVVGAVWGLLLATKLLRGEEDAGRWELLLAGQTTRRRASAQALAGLAAGLVVLWALTAVITVLTGQSSKVGFTPAASLFFALTLVCPAVVFVAAGALASQLATTRRRAAGYAGAGLGVAYALRLVADSSPGLAWMRWTSPLGWVEELQPFNAPRPLALLPVLALVLVLCVLTVYLAGRRDLASGVLPERSTARPRTRLLSGPAALAVRLARPMALVWAAAICAMALLMGSIAKQGGSALTSSASFQQGLSRLGIVGGGAAEYLGFTFLTIALMVALVAAGQVGTTRGEEAEGRIDNILVRPVSRTAWLAGRMALATLLLLANGLLAGLFAWFGVLSNGAGVSLGSLLDAGLNVVAPAVLVLGFGVLAIGVSPRAATAATYGLIAWSFLIELLAGFVNYNHWLLDTSVFHQITAAPAQSPDWVSLGVVVAIGVAAGLAGGACFRRRDLASE
jgi:ABC-2 type transport system permease protein